MRTSCTGFVALAFVLSVGGVATAQRLTGTVTLRFDGAGPNKTGTVTFTLPSRTRFAGKKITIPNPALAGTHTCTLNPALVGGGRIDMIGRLNRGPKGTVFRAIATDGAANSLLVGGCDGDPGTADDFQGDVTAFFAEPFLWIAQGLAATDFSATTVEQEIRDFFAIDPSKTRIVVKVIEGHGITAQSGNRGGSATGIGSARVSLRFRR